MGFMDKAKKLAEQAQQKLDEAQQNFNQGGSTAGQQGRRGRYDEHGRPVHGRPARRHGPAALGGARPRRRDAGRGTPPAAEPAGARRLRHRPPPASSGGAPTPPRPVQAARQQ